MRWNEGEVCALAQQTPSWEGKLLHRLPVSKGSGVLSGIWSSSTSTEPRERWFKLRANCLFYYRLNPNNVTGRPAVGTEPLGVLVLETFHVQPEGFETPNAFSIIFAEASGDKHHYFVAENPRHVKQWVSALKNASYQGLRDRLVNLQISLRQKTGCDPLLGTAFENNPLFSAPMSDAPMPFSEPPVPKPRKPKQRSTFQSHVVENWETFSPHNDSDDDDEENGHLKKPSFQSHVPTANLLDL